MTKYFVIIFLAFAIYGFATDHHGGALLSAVMVLFTLYGHRELRKRDIEFYTHPRSAKAVPSTQELLERHNCEAS